MAETSHHQFERHGPQRLKNMPSAGFFVSTVIGAVLFVFGTVAMFLAFRDRGDFSGDSVLAACAVVGIALIVLAFLGERPGPARRIVVIVRNCLIGLVALVVLLATLFVITGPYH